MESPVDRKTTLTDMEQKYITFTLGGEDFGVPVLQVIEIVKIENLITIPQSNRYFLGLMDIRGNILPIVNLRARLELQAEDLAAAANAEDNMAHNHSVFRRDQETRAIITEVGERRVGLGVDRVTHVFQFPPDSIDPGPATVRGVASRCVIGVGKQKDRLVVLMNLQNLFTSEEISTLYGIEQ